MKKIKSAYVKLYTIENWGQRANGTVIFLAYLLTLLARNREINIEDIYVFLQSLQTGIKISHFEKWYIMFEFFLCFIYHMTLRSAI